MVDHVLTHPTDYREDIADIVKWLNDVRKNYSSATAPTVPAPEEGQLWWDSTNDIPYFYDGSSWNKITAEAIEYGKSLVKTDASVLDVAEKIEEKIKQLGGEPAFPVNISFNHIAAHYTPEVNDALVFKDEIIKLDIGAHVEGCIGDSAVTVDLSSFELSFFPSSFSISCIIFSFV